MTSTGSSDRLFAEVDAPGTGPRVVLVHGFTQTRACWGDLPARFMAAGREVMRVDLPGHGQSGHADADLCAAADLLAVTAGPATYFGYSFGARVALHLAIAHPKQVDRLILLGGTPGLVDPHARAARREEDERRAARLEEVGLERFLDEWLALPLFAGLRPKDTFREARLENTVAGLASSLRACGTGSQEPLWVKLDELEMPVLCLAGELDEKFATVAAHMAAGIGPNARFETVPGAGHTAHLERPDAFWQVLDPWLSATQPNRW